MEATQENWVAHQNGQSLYLKYCLQLETKEDVEVVVWDFKGAGGNSHGDGKTNVW